MSVIFVCDGCGKQQEGERWPRGTFKPSHWYTRSDDDGEQHACSRKCIEVVAEKTGKTDLVNPI